MIDLQSPDVGRALAKHFQISGAGRLPFGLEQSVVPVAIVADVQNDVRNASIPFGAVGELAAGGAGQYAHWALENPATSNVNLILERIDFYTATTAIFRLSFVNPSGVAIASTIHGRRSGSLGGSLASFFSGTTAVVKNPAFALAAPVVQGNAPFAMTLEPGALVVEPGGRFEIGNTTANLANAVGMWWREEGRF